MSPRTGNPSLVMVSVTSAPLSPDSIQRRISKYYQEFGIDPKAAADAGKDVRLVFINQMNQLLGS